MDIWFFHLTRQPLERALPILLERSVERGWRAVVQAPGEERLAALDAALWTYADDSFLAHGLARDGDGAMQPVYLTTGEETPNGAAARFFVDGAEIAPFLATPGAESYQRCVLLFNGDDPDDLAAARAQWKALKERELDLAYWRQGETGWEKIA